ncbi:hypothetical protein ACIQUS_23175 [Pseudomonas sp. NPDC090755]|uniref:hypothetical protein n=1 Tax=Pseudomonas sp. NPDC090755 TaxID=3364481 RepID=UPI00383A9BF6
MSDIITGSNPLILEARELRKKVAALGGNQRLLAKLDDLLSKQSLHSAEQAKLINLIEAAKNVT